MRRSRSVTPRGRSPFFAHRLRSLPFSLQAPPGPAVVAATFTALAIKFYIVLVT